MSRTPADIRISLKRRGPDSCGAVNVLSGGRVPHVASTDEPIIVQRYERQDVMLVPAWEWRFLKRLEAAVRSKQIPWDELPGPVTTTWTGVKETIGCTAEAARIV